MQIDNPSASTPTIHRQIQAPAPKISHPREPTLTPPIQYIDYNMDAISVDTQTFQDSMVPTSTSPIQSHTCMLITPTLTVTIQYIN